MSGLNLPETPKNLKSIQSYLKIAAEHEQRDIVVTYWCRLYALQTGLKLSSKTPEETNFFLKLMDWLETTKKQLVNNEAITNEVAAQAHIDNWAHKLFMFADENDRKGNFNKSVIQSFYTAGFLYDVLTTFGDLSDESIQNRKYAKWKAAYIHSCLKNGTVPESGPAKEENEDSSNENEDAEAGPSISSVPSMPSMPPMPSLPSMPPSTMNNFNYPIAGGNQFNPTPPTPMEPFDFPSASEPNPYNPAPTPTNANYDVKILKTEGVELSAEQTAKAQKYIKWAGSALNYDDIPTSVENLQKALHLLTTGKDPA